MTPADRCGRPGRAWPLRMVALGGIGEIGRNMTVYEFDGRLLIVDCGVLFPEDAQPGVDLILPDLRLVEDRVDDIDAVVITHGHEDHIGALPWLLRLRKDLPVIGARFSLALIAAKCREHRITPKLEVVAEGERRTVGPFDLEFFAVNHSIPDALAVGIRTPAGTVLHTGDIKLDQLPLDGRLTDLGGFSRLGDEGVDLFLVDSTNAEVPGFVAPEREIGPVLDSYIRTATAAGDRGVLRLARAPGAADDRLRPAVRPQGRVRRPVDGPQHADRPGSRSADGARRPGPVAGQGAGPAARPGAADLHRLAGRAAVRAVPDVPRRPPAGQPASRGTRSSWRPR